MAQVGWVGRVDYFGGTARPVNADVGDNKMKRLFTAVIIAIAALLTLAISSFLLGGSIRIENRREARIDTTKNAVQCIISGYHPMLISVEGPFPRWSNDMYATLTEGRRLPSKGSIRLIYPDDFASRYDIVKAGSIIVDADKRLVTVDLQYVDGYSWCKVTGDFPITITK